MNTKMLSIIAFLFISIMNGNILCQIDTNRIVIMPFITQSIDNTTLKSAEAILRQDVAKLTQTEVFVGSKPAEAVKDTSCQSLDCIVKYGENQKADKVITCNFLVLGQKIIIQYSLIDVKEKKLKISDSMNSMSLEELDVIMKRVALSTIKNETANESAVVGAITESESKKQLRRGGGKFYGFSFGYLYPAAGFDNTERSFTMDFKFGSELENMDYGLQLFARNGFGANIFASYLFTQKDICPYIGGGAGFHWITNMGKDQYIYNNNSYTYIEDKRKEDGFELLLNTGVRLFHTYNFRITANLSYSYTFNDFDSESFALTVGFLY